MDRSILDKRWPWLTATAAIVAVYLSTFVEIRIPGSDPRPVGSAEDIARLSERNDVNILFVLIDTLRADRLGSYGYARDTSPTLDRLAASGVRFSRHLSQSSWTKASMASLWTGLYPNRTGVTRFEHVIPEAARLPAEILRDAGFRTAAIFRNGWVEGYFGFDQGFDTYSRPASHPPPASVRRENPTLKAVGSDADTVAAAIEYLRVFGRDRWLLYLHLMDVHEYLYDEDSALFGSDYEDVYDNSILRENFILEGLFQHLAQKRLLEKTLIVVAADHGEAFGERGIEGHARAVYSETTNVPLIMSFPFRLEGGVVIEANTSNVDIWPTVLDLMGLPPLGEIDGRSRVPEILSTIERRPTNESPAALQDYAHLDRTWGRRERSPSPMVAVREGAYRYVQARDERGRISELLFDSSRDPLERQNVLQGELEVSARLRELAGRYLESKPPWGDDTPTLELDEVQLNQLRALGYKIP